MVQPNKNGSSNRSRCVAGLQSFSEWRAAALEKWASYDSAIKGQLLQASRLGSRLGIIEAVDQLVEHQEPQLQECFEGKDEIRALELLERDELSEALAWAPPSSELFSRILARRIRRSYESGELARCSRDCRFARSLNPPDDPRAAIELLLLQANCSRTAKEPPELARELLNLAMRRINEFAGNDASIKAQILQSCRPQLQQQQQTPASSSWTSHCSSNLPAPPALLNGRAHDWLSCCSDVLAMSQDRARGRFLYATQNIKPGSVLIVDRPFSFSTDAAAFGTNCASCHLSFRLCDITQIPCETCSTVRYCSEKCRRSAWDQFHKYECRVMSYFIGNEHLQKCNALLTYRTVIAAAINSHNKTDGAVILNEEFLRLHENDKDSMDLIQEQQDKYEPNNYKTVFSLKTHSADRELRENLENTICCIFLTKCLMYSLEYLGIKLEYCSSRKLKTILAAGFLHSMQAIKCNAYEIVENLRNEETKILEPRNVGGAIYTSVSLTNHSCYPNTVRHCFPNGVIVVTSLRFIAQGEEILDCYGQHFLANDRDHRRRHLKTKYYFECQCEACLMDWPMKLPALQPSTNVFRSKCKRCSSSKLTNTALQCTECDGRKTATGQQQQQQQQQQQRLYNSLQSSIEQKRIVALTKMYDGHYNEALPLLLEHAIFIGKILSEPSLEAVKTQQSIIQCLNAMSLVAPFAEENEQKID